MRYAAIIILLCSLMFSSGCVLGMCALAERHAQAEEKRTGIKRVFKVVEPWEVNPGN